MCCHVSQVRVRESLCENLASGESVQKCFSVLQCVPVCCSVLQCVAACRSALQGVAGCCNGRWCVCVCAYAKCHVVFIGLFPYTRSLFVYDVSFRI